MASDTSHSVWGDRNDFGHWNKHFFSLCNIIYYSQHIINLKACLNTGRCAIALHQERFLTLKRSPLLLPCLMEKVDRTAFFVSLQPIISHKPVERRSISFLSSTFLHLFLIWTVLGTWITRRALGWGTKHPAVELPQSPAFTLITAAESTQPRVLQKEISFGSGNAAVVSKWYCTGASEPYLLGHGFLTHGYAASLTPTISAWVPTRLPLQGISNEICVGMQMFLVIIIVITANIYIVYV